MRQRYFWSSSFAAIAALGLAMPAAAQESSADGQASQNNDSENSIIVTAQKREQALEEIPLAISAETGDELRAQGVSDVRDLTNAVPFVKISTNVGIPNIYIRGIGSSFLGVGGDGSVAFHIDGGYISRPRAQIAGFYDIERVEVLRGPQGTLYGRNATGGNLNVITRRPTDYVTGYARVTVGNYGRIDGEAAIGGPIAGDTVMGRVSFMTNNHSGFGDNIALDEPIDTRHEWGVRGQLLFEPDDRSSVLLSGDYFKADDNSFGWHIGTESGREGVPLVSEVLGGSGPPEDVRDINSLVPNRRNVEVYGFSATVDYDISDSLTFRSITAYRSSLSDVDTDISTGVADPAITTLPLATLSQYEKADWFSEEAQLLWSGDNFDALIGVYYFTEDLDGDVIINWRSLPILGSGGLGIIPVPFEESFPNFRQLGSVETEAFAAFVNFEFRPTDRLTLIAGLRYSDEKRSRQGAFTAPTPFANSVIPSVGENSWDAFTPKGTIDYRLTEDIHAYVTVGRGFKSGVLIAGSANPPVEPEFVTNYEIGIKGTFAGGSFSAAGFYNDYTDLQLNRIVGAAVTLENAADARIYGIEGEFRAELSDSFTLGAQGTWVVAEFQDYVIADPTRLELGLLNLAGNRLPQAPEFSFSVDATQEFYLDNESRLVLRADWSWTDDVFFDPFNQPNNFQKANHYLGARASWISPDERYTVSVWGRNITGATVLTSGAISSDNLGFPHLFGLNEPFTFGADLEINF